MNNTSSRAKAYLYQTAVTQIREFFDHLICSKACDAIIPQLAEAENSMNVETLTVNVYKQQWKVLKDLELSKDDFNNYFELASYLYNNEFHAKKKQSAEDTEKFLVNEFKKLIPEKLLATPHFITPSKGKDLLPLDQVANHDQNTQQHQNTQQLQNAQQHQNTQHEILPGEDGIYDIYSNTSGSVISTEQLQPKEKEKSSVDKQNTDVDDYFHDDESSNEGNRHIKVKVAKKRKRRPSEDRNFKPPSTRPKFNSTTELETFQTPSKGNSSKLYKELMDLVTEIFEIETNCWVLQNTDSTCYHIFHWLKTSDGSKADCFNYLAGNRIWKYVRPDVINDADADNCELSFIRVHFNLMYKLRELQDKEVDDDTVLIDKALEDYKLLSIIDEGIFGKEEMKKKVEKYGKKLIALKNKSKNEVIFSKEEIFFPFIWKYLNDNRFYNLNCCVNNSIIKVIKNETIIEEPFSVLDLVTVAPYTIQKSAKGWFLETRNVQASDQLNVFNDEVNGIVEKLCQIYDFLDEHQLREDLDYLSKLYRQYSHNPDIGNS